MVYMPGIIFRNKDYECKSSETVLESLQRQGVEISFSCRKGSCQTCLLKCVSGELPPASQKNLRPVLASNGYFMPCVCVPVGDMVIEDVAHQDLYFTAVVNSKSMLSDNVCRLLLDAEALTGYWPGQFINLSRPVDGVTRSYSIANRVDDYFIEIHVQRKVNGILSNWIFDELIEGDTVEIQGPNGGVFYPDNSIDRPLLMISSATGLAPHLGILRDAIDHHHKADIYLYHGSQSEGEAYLFQDMNQLVSRHNNLHYFPCVPAGCESEEFYTAKPEALALQHHQDLAGFHVFIAGSPAMVESVSATLLELGVAAEDIHADPFDFRDLRYLDMDSASTSSRRKSDKAAGCCAAIEEADYPEPDAEMWQALEYGKKLNQILNDFYDRVYQDERLLPFFANTTKKRSIEKQFTFLRRLFSGEKVYFGDRPRNAHHWMVISDELFDYRESIMRSCLIQHGLSASLIERWFETENLFRKDIVKEKPWNRIMDGVEIPVDGYEETILDIGSLCDSCHQEIAGGTMVRYHVRLGLVYCPACMQDH